MDLAGMTSGSDDNARRVKPESAHVKATVAYFSTVMRQVLASAYRHYDSECGGLGKGSVGQRATVAMQAFAACYRSVRCWQDWTPGPGGAVADSITLGEAKRVFSEYTTYEAYAAATPKPSSEPMWYERRGVVKASWTEEYAACRETSDKFDEVSVVLYMYSLTQSW